MATEFQQFYVMDIVGMYVTWVRVAHARPGTRDALLAMVMSDLAMTMMKEMDGGATFKCGACDIPTAKKGAWGFAIILPLTQPDDKVQYTAQPVCDDCGRMGSLELVDLVSKSFAKAQNGEVVWLQHPDKKA